MGIEDDHGKISQILNASIRYFLLYKESRGTYDDIKAEKGDY